MTDIWCFDCSHEIKRELLSDRYAHLDPDDEDGCPCIDEEDGCVPL